MVQRCFSISTYTSPTPEEEWSLHKLGEKFISVTCGAYRSPTEIARHVAANCVTQTHFLVMDVAEVGRRLDAISKSLPRIIPKFALECNGDPILAMILATHSEVTFEARNLLELKMALQHVGPGRTIYCSQLLTKKNIRDAVAAGCRRFVVEDVAKMEVVMTTAPDAEILLAISLPYSTAEVPFGMSLEKAEEAFDTAYSIGANVIGIHLEIGVETSSDIWKKVVEDVKHIFSTASKQRSALRHLSLGNFILPNSDHDAGFICRELNEVFARSFNSSIQISANVSQNLVNKAFLLATRIIGKRNIEAKALTNDDFDEGEGFVYQISEGIFGSFNCKIMGIKPTWKLLEEKVSQKSIQHFGTILGPSLDRTDVVQRIILSRELEIGEWLVWENMGSYLIGTDAEVPTPAVFYYMVNDDWELFTEQATHNQHSGNNLETDQFNAWIAQFDGCFQ